MMQDKKIFTGYIAKTAAYIKNGLIPITICGKAPELYLGLQYRKLAPTWEIYSRYKAGKYSEKDYEFYFMRDVLSKLNRSKVIEDIFQMTMNQPAILLCYETPGEFCHRHLVANWLNELCSLKIDVPYIIEFTDF